MKYLKKYGRFKYKKTYRKKAYRKKAIGKKPYRKRLSTRRQRKTKLLGRKRLRYKKKSSGKTFIKSKSLKKKVLKRITKFNLKKANYNLNSASDTILGNSYPSGQFMTFNSLKRVDDLSPYAVLRNQENYAVMGNLFEKNRMLLFDDNLIASSYDKTITNPQIKTKSVEFKFSGIKINHVLFELLTPLSLGEEPMSYLAQFLSLTKRQFEDLLTLWERGTYVYTFSVDVGIITNTVVNLNRYLTLPGATIRLGTAYIDWFLACVKWFLNGNLTQFLDHCFVVMDNIPDRPVIATRLLKTGLTRFAFSAINTQVDVIAHFRLASNVIALAAWLVPNNPDILEAGIVADFPPTRSYYHDTLKLLALSSDLIQSQFLGFLSDLAQFIKAEANMVNEQSYFATYLIEMFKEGSVVSLYLYNSINQLISSNVIRVTQESKPIKYIKPQANTRAIYLALNPGTSVNIRFNIYRNFAPLMKLFEDTLISAKLASKLTTSGKNLIRRLNPAFNMSYAI